MKPDWTGLLGFFWLVLLGAALLVSAATAYSKTRHIEEHAWGCDPFGYLRMADVVRRALDRGQWPDYRIETPQNRLLIERMKLSGLPTASWGEMVAPHAHHYFPRSDRVAVQYPPGTGLLLALFPRGEAVQGLCTLVIAAFLVVGFTSLVIAGVTRSWVAAGGVIFALHLGLTILGRLGAISFSVNTVLMPLLVGVALAGAALGLRATWGRSRAGTILSFLAGLSMGYAMLIRLPVLFLVPGTALILVGSTWRTIINATLIAFFLGFCLAGPLPLVVHQQLITGSPFDSTYGSDDNSPPSVSVVERNYRFYFRGGPGAEHNWALPVALGGFVTLVLGTRSPVGAARIVLSALAIWGISTAYFLTHKIAIGYYQIPAIFAAVTVLAFGGLARQATRWRVPAEAAGPFSFREATKRLALVAALLPGVVAIKGAWADRPNVPLSFKVNARQIEFPAELAAERAWIFADLLTGPCWYYAGKPAYKVTFGDAQARKLACQLAFERGEPLFAIRDCESMQAVLEELKAQGAVLEERGSVDNSPYYLVRWPSGGPRRVTTHGP